MPAARHFSIAAGLLCACVLAACGPSQPQTAGKSSQTATQTAGKSSQTASRSARTDGKSAQAVTTSAKAERPAVVGTGSPACPQSAETSAAVLPGAPLDTVLRVPPGVRGRPAPLLVVLHYGGGNGPQMEQLSRFTTEAARSGFIVAYPTATSAGLWSIKADLGKLAKTLDVIERVACVDRSRVYVSGMSKGGFMAAVMACRMADRVAAVALFAPAFNGVGACKPARAVSILEIHGSSDPLVPYRGVAPFLAGWVRRDGCASRPSTRRTHETVTVTTWSTCRDDAEVEHLRLTGGRHLTLFPQLRAAGVDPAATAWAFLSAHRLPAR